MSAPILVAVSATKLRWSSEFRAYARDHCNDLAIEVIVTVRGLLQPSHRSFDVLLVDDVMRLVSASDVAGAHDRQVHVIGISDRAQGLGRAYLEELGVDQIAPSSVLPGELANLVRNIGPKNAHTEDRLRRVTQAGERTSASQPGARLTAFVPTSGGTGVSETIVAVAETLAEAALRVLVIEANEVQPDLAARLRLSPHSGLPWALSRAQQALTVFPGGLSGPIGDGTRPIGRFDAICGISSPGGPTPVNPFDLVRVFQEALVNYDHVLVDTGPWLTSHTGRDRLGAARATLELASSALVFCRSTPDGVSHLVEWVANARDNGVSVPLWAVFGRCRDRYERAHLGNVLRNSTTSFPTLAGAHYLPEDRRLAKARWNAQLVRSGPWLRAVRRVAEDLAGSRSRGAGASSAAVGVRHAAHAIEDFTGPSGRRS